MMNMQVYRYIFKKLFGHSYSISKADTHFSCADYQALVSLAYIMQRQGLSITDYTYNFENGILTSDEILEDMKKSMTIPESYVILYPEFKSSINKLKKCIEKSSSNLNSLEETIIAAANYDFYTNYLERTIYIPTAERYKELTTRKNAQIEFDAGQKFWDNINLSQEETEHIELI